ncbi:DUF1302 domain-containing protein [Roseateles koreensis]|uniref:DUF1302 domain-containing protein n=1 Tax=Roseateles koreensis TaxID=2987526 RepID=A0ABT5KP72_9BURK|nr:DUF1302 domain-containing protein [Roseateles koreensis]MDC8784651.1 DUF1302 domain-containing protein [Roseateles koreensis]
MKTRHSFRDIPRLACIPMAAAMTMAPALAMDFDTGHPDFKLRWDNTVKYSAALRLNSRSEGLSTTAFGPTGIVGPNNINQDDGDNNFDKGWVSSRLDLLSELDASYQNFGFRVSGAAWYDSVYNRSNDNTSRTANHTPANEFTEATRKVMGRKAEFLDAFVFGNFTVGDRTGTVRLGRHTVLWGESLFFGANGIAGGMAPLDLVKLLSVPNAQFKEIARPTGKLSTQLQLTDSVSLGAYLGYEWEKTRMMPVGAYLSGSDALGDGAERINAGSTGVFNFAGDIRPRNSGQGGVQLRWRADAVETDFGFYAIRYHATTPSNIYTTLTGLPPALSASSYQWAYAEGIQAYGVSFSKAVGEWGLAGEASYRRNAPLSSAGQSILSTIHVNTGLDNQDNPGYAVGDTAHLNFSWIASFGPSFIAREASFVGEIAWNERVRVTKNEGMLNPNATRSATATRMTFSPTYRQALPGWDLTPTVGVGYGWGRSSAVGNGFSPDNGGDVNVGLAGAYLANWYLNFNVVHYLGKEGSTLDNNSNAQFLQALKDRDFVSISLRTTF